MCHKLVCNRDFSFIGACDESRYIDKPVLYVTIKDSINKDIGSYTWPSAVVLGQFLWYHRQILDGKSFCEIGCGTALPSIVALKCLQPQVVILADKICTSRESLKANDLTKYVDHFNNAIEEKSWIEQKEQLQVHVLPLVWGEISSKLISIQNHYNPEIILGSDCFYNPEVFEDVISTVYFLLKSYSKTTKNGKKAKFFCTYQTRSADWTIADLLQEWGMQCAHIPLHTFDADHSSIAMSDLPGKHLIQMLEISLLN